MELRHQIHIRIEKENRASFRRVINATGILLHTNLGRAPLGRRQMEAAYQAMAGYGNLEYELEEGKRGKRQNHYQKLICQVTGAEASVAVNNNAAAVTLILSALARNREVIISRGELVEIGGHFRIPEVMEESGSVLREAGCTNRTRIDDYRKAVTENTGAFLKVHTSNYKIIGFTESPSVEELVEAGKEYHVPVIVDLGSGVLVNLEKLGLSHEPTVQEMLKKGADIVCFSGDKLLGGPQAGIITGKKKYIEIIENHPMMRALRLDKCTTAVLEATFREYLKEETVWENIPVLNMLRRQTEELKSQAEEIKAALLKDGFEGKIQVSGRYCYGRRRFSSGRDAFRCFSFCKTGKRKRGSVCCTSATAEKSCDFSGKERRGAAAYENGFFRGKGNAYRNVERSVIVWRVPVRIKLTRGAFSRPAQVLKTRGHTSYPTTPKPLSL